MAGKADRNRKGVSLSVFECLFEVTLMDLHPLQQLAVDADGIRVTDSRVCIFAEGDIECTGLVYPVEPIETSPVQEEKERRIFYRIKIFRLYLVRTVIKKSFRSSSVPNSRYSFSICCNDAINSSGESLTVR